MLMWTTRCTPAFLGSFEKSEGILHGIGVFEQAVIKSHPVGVVENRDAFPVVGQELWMVEMERECLDSITERIQPGQ